MKNYSFPSISLPLDDTWDVIVLGGGPAGCAAAIAAARENAKTLLVEGTGCLGGMGTLGLVPAWTPFSDQEKIIYRGIAEKIFTACTSGIPHVAKGALDWVPIDPERLKRIYDTEVTSAGAHVLFHTQLSHVVAKDGEIQTVILTNKAGLSAYRAKAYIDCTGDADLCARAEAPFHKGNANGEKLMPCTLCFVLSNVDDYAYRHGPALYAANPDSPIYKIRASGKYPLISDLHICNNLIGPGTVGFNAGHVWLGDTNLDATNPQSVSEAMIHGRKIACSFRDALAEFFPSAFGNAYLVNTGSLLGVRETRRVIGDYELTLDDYLDRRSFPDEIARNSYFIDIHHAKESAALTHAQQQAVETNAIRYKRGETHGIPYRCLTPKTLKNVLVAGRSISCEQTVQGSVRVMPTCLTTGEAAGLAAAQAAVSGGNVHEVDIANLRDKLIGYGAYLPPVNT
jgi:hypothetical protein